MSAEDVPQLDTRHAHPARIYNYWLGGKDNFAADREAAEQAIAANPRIVTDVRANRAFLVRVVRYLAAEGAPDARIVYADNDPVVLQHAQALLTSTPEGACDSTIGSLST